MLSREAVAGHYRDTRPGFDFRWADKRRQATLEAKGWEPVESDGEVDAFLGGQFLFQKKKEKMT